jgi:phosphopantetheine adenylyltransferase
MGAKIKPVQPTEIKDKKIIQEVIAQIHRKPTKRDLTRVEERREVLKKAMAK